MSVTAISLKLDSSFAHRSDVKGMSTVKTFYSAESLRYLYRYMTGFCACKCRQEMEKMYTQTTDIVWQKVSRSGQSVGKSKCTVIEKMDH